MWSTGLNEVSVISKFEALLLIFRLLTYISGEMCEIANIFPNLRKIKQNYNENINHVNFLISSVAAKIM